MTKDKKPLISEEFLTELAEEINHQYGFPKPQTQKDSDAKEQNSKR
jgi:hypothetical protein